jgi:hypothetical protein
VFFGRSYKLLCGKCEPTPHVMHSMQSHAQLDYIVYSTVSPVWPDHYFPCDRSQGSCCTHAKTNNSASTCSCTTVPSKPHQPRNFHFPKRFWGQKMIVKWAFQTSRFDHFVWLHYKEAKNATLCHVCCSASNSGWRRKPTRILVQWSKVASNHGIDSVGKNCFKNRYTALL